MKTLEEIKEIVAKQNRFCDWKELLKCSTADMIDEHFTVAAEWYASQFNTPPISVIGTGSISAGLIEQIKAFHPDFIVIASLEEQEKLIEKYTDMLLPNPFQDIRTILPPKPVEQLKTWEEGNYAIPYKEPKSKHHK